MNVVLTDSEQDCLRSRRFVEAFIRPHGVGVAATPVFAREVERLVSATTPPVRDPLGISVLRAALAPVAALTRVQAAAPLVLSAHERAIAARDRAHRNRVRDAWRVKDALKAVEQRQKEERLARRQRHKAERAAEWRRTKTMHKLKQRIKKRIGIAS
jgi:hypothetical protein